MIFKIKRQYRTKYDKKKKCYAIEQTLNCDLWPFWSIYKEAVGYPGNGDFPVYFKSEDGAANKIIKLEIDQDPGSFPEFFV